jgi:hypothetical protein
MNDGPGHHLALRQADQACADFCAIEDELGQLARLPTKKDMARTALMALLAGSTLTIALIELFFPQGWAELDHHGTQHKVC